MNRNSLGVGLLSAFLLLAVTQGCGDDDNANPTPPDVTTGGSNTSGGTANKAGSTGKGGNGKGGDSANGATGGVGENPGGAPSTDGGTGAVGGEGGDTNQPPIPECTLPELGENGCFNCPKDKNVKQWLNRCVDSDCIPFPHTLPLLNADGSRPALPN